MKTMFAIDIETLGNVHNSVITQIAAVEFTHKRIYRCYSTNVSIESCEEIGLVKTKSTVEWWKLNGNKYHAIGVSTLDIDKALKELFIFANPLFENYIWSKGTNFDLNILETAYTLCEKHYPGFTFVAPWKYNRKLDMRTAFKLFPEKINPGKPPHNALADILMQTRLLIDNIPDRLEAILKKQEENNG